MIDGIQLTYSTRNPKSHLLGFPCWELLVNEKTGQRVSDIRSTHLRGLDLKLKPSISGGFNLIVNGSLHKFHNCGEHNTDQFTFLKLLQSIDSLTDLFCIEAPKCTIHGLEIGVNINLPFSPLRVLKNLVCYRSRPFTQINKRNFRKGLQCSFSQYSVKVYDKAEQSGTDCGHVLRLEVAIDKMQVLAKYGIVTLADLQDVQKVYTLVNILKDALSGIIWTDTATNLNRLTNREQKQWLNYSNPNTWKSLGKYQRSRAAKTWANLLHKYGAPPDLLPLILQTWDSLFLGENEAENPQLFYRPISESEAFTTATILPLECTVKRSRLGTGKAALSNTTFSFIENSHVLANKGYNTPHPKRPCLACGKDISRQREGSKFCSDKFNGKEGKRCRNTISNRRRGRKRLIQKAMAANNYLVFTYIDEAGTACTDTLHPNELKVTKEWLDRVQNITILTIGQSKNTKTDIKCNNYH